MTKAVVPSPKLALTFVASTRTTVSGPTRARSKANDPVRRCPASESTTFVPSTRRYGPAGSDRPTTWLPTWTEVETAAPVVLTASEKVPLKPSGATTPGRATVTVPLTRPATPAVVTTNRPLPALRCTPAVVVPRSSATSVAKTRTVLGAALPGGADGESGPLTCSKPKTPCRLLLPKVSVASDPVVPTCTRSDWAGMPAWSAVVVLIRSAIVGALMLTPGTANVRPAVTLP